MGVQVLEPERPALLTVRQVAHYLGIKHTKCYEMLNRRELPVPIRLGRCTLIARTALDRWIEERQAEAETAAAGSR